MTEKRNQVQKSAEKCRQMQANAGKRRQVIDQEELLSAGALVRGKLVNQWDNEREVNLMSKALRKQEPLPEPRETLTDSIVRLERATEAMMAYIGYLTTEVMKERAATFPNQAKIDALEEQRQIVLADRKAIMPDDMRLIAKALYVYAPIMKALDA